MKKDKPKKIKLLLVDDHPIVLDGIKSHLCAQPDFEVVGDAANGQEALRKAKLTLPDVILMDISMPLMDGIAAAKAIRAADADACILMLTGSNSRTDVDQARQAGAAGYVTKDRIAAELIDAILEVVPR